MGIFSLRQDSTMEKMAAVVWRQLFFPLNDN
jgi:hypothetical protein